MEHSPKPEDRQDEQEEEAEGERHVTAMQRFVGFVMLVLGWLLLLLAVSSGSEATSVPFLIFFDGVLFLLYGTVTALSALPLILNVSIDEQAITPRLHSHCTAILWV